jgi:hypothetical protein
MDNRDPLGPYGTKVCIKVQHIKCGTCDTTWLETHYLTYRALEGSKSGVSQS